MLAVAVTADGATAVTGGEDGTVRVWDLTRKGAGEAHRPPGPVWAVAVTADGATAVTGGRDVTVRVWDLTRKKEQARLTGHDRRVRAVAVTADGATAASGGDDLTVRVWDLATGKEVARWTGDHTVIACTVLSSRPFKIAVGQKHGQPYLLKLRG